MDTYLNIYPFKGQDEISIEQRAEDYSKEIIALCKSLDTLPTNGIDLQKKLEQAYWKQFEKYSTIDYPHLKKDNIYPITLKKDNLQLLFTSGNVKSISTFNPLCILSLDIRLPDDDNYDEGIKEFHCVYDLLKKAFISEGYPPKVEFIYPIEELFLNAAFFQIENIYVVIHQYDSLQMYYNFTISAFIVCKDDFQYYSSEKADISKLFIGYNA